MKFVCLYIWKHESSFLSFCFEHMDHIQSPTVDITIEYFNAQLVPAMSNVNGKHILIMWISMMSLLMLEMHLCSSKSGWCIGVIVP